ncbi:8-oxo-dGTP diphosphatase [Mucilaginibacter mallensis]|uniref:8-oxo-dGTP diphosphatase n=1 Tax=Mucilaginibacter mallensis TaxID=652787 RepID=A0A1H1S625_MUCMA|nr:MULTISPECIES: NUDIX domain-containing protein [Mucilaginibacter]MBB6140710.1 8-oxo-dGTP diphosphatase [Mucilaginibacter sp. X5P1]SDS43363.1 8-oxo-dGTP diphosphatase [Mucilaginibacter mallensis]
MEIHLPHLDSVFSTDCVIFGFEAGELKVLLIERNEEPFKDWYALPGNIVGPDESVDAAAQRILYELTGLHDLPMRQFHTFGEVNRHPQGRVVTIAYFALIRIGGQKDLMPITQYARKAFWHPVNDLPTLAFDHTEIFKRAFKKIRAKLNYEPIAFELLPEKFTLTQLQSLYEAVLSKQLDKRNFRKKMLSYGFLKELAEKQKGVSYRAAKLYKFDRRKYAKIFQNEIAS